MGKIERAKQIYHTKNSREHGRLDLSQVRLCLHRIRKSLQLPSLSRDRE